MNRLATLNADVLALLEPERLDPLDAGTPDLNYEAPLAVLTPASVCAPYGVANASMARACLAGLWLHHGFLERSHEISQQLNSSTGAYWHGLMHRREPDASNAAYWMRQVRQHSIHGPLQTYARGLVVAGGVDSRADYIATQDQWNALSFIDLCETYRGTSSSTERLCQKIQLEEWRLLFEFCWQRATQVV